MAIKIQHSIHTLRLKVKAEGYAWLNEAAIEVNDVRERVIAFSRGAEPDI